MEKEKGSENMAEYISVCQKHLCIYVTQHTKFCHNCGANMDGGIMYEMEQSRD